MQQGRLTARTIAEIGAMAALLEVSKFALMMIPNVELVTFEIILFTLYLGPLAMIAVLIFVGVEILIWGAGLWTMTYLYVWPLLVLLVLPFRKSDSVWTFSFLSGLYGLFFGALCSIPFLFIGGTQSAFGMWVSGIPYDLIHCVANFIICLVLFQPMHSLLCKIKSGKMQLH